MLPACAEMIQEEMHTTTADLSRAFTAMDDDVDTDYESGSEADADLIELDTAAALFTDARLLLTLTGAIFGAIVGAVVTLLLLKRRSRMQSPAGSQLGRHGSAKLSLLAHPGDVTGSVDIVVMDSPARVRRHISID